VPTLCLSQPASSHETPSPYRLIKEQGTVIFIIFYMIAILCVAWLSNVGHSKTEYRGIF
jgi:hypothetical protein